jgi:hypothetical protein
MRRSDPLLTIVGVAFAPLVVGLVAIFRQLPEGSRVTAIQFDHAIDTVGAAFAMTTVALLLVSIAFRSAGVDRLIRRGDAITLSMGAWAAFFLALGALDKDDMNGALIGGGVGAALVVIGAVAAILWELAKGPLRPSAAPKARTQPKRTPDVRDDP